MESMMITTQINARKLIGHGALIGTGLFTGGLSAALFILLAAATGI
jgi:hypothetical protein